MGTGAFVLDASPDLGYRLPLAGRGTEPQFAVGSHPLSMLDVLHADFMPPRERILINQHVQNGHFEIILLVDDQ